MASCGDECGKSKVTLRVDTQWPRKDLLMEIAAHLLSNGNILGKEQFFLSKVLFSSLKRKKSFLLIEQWQELDDEVSLLVR